MILHQTNMSVLVSIWLGNTVALAVFDRQVLFVDGTAIECGDDSVVSKVLVLILVTVVVDFSLPEMLAGCSSNMLTSYLVGTLC